jgi:hemolysin III
MRFAAPFEGVKPVLRGWMHAASAIAALTLAPIVIVMAPSGTRLVAGLYTGAIVALFSVSAVYHRFPWKPGIRGFWKRLDHSMIFVAIAATYTPVVLFVLPDSTGHLILAAVWIGAAIGIGTQVAWPTAPSWVTVIPYMMCGWAILPAIGQVWDRMELAGFILLVVGGVLFSAGAAVYAVKRPDPWPSWFGYHEVFHVFVTAGVAVHYVSVTFFALPHGGSGIS